VERQGLIRRAALASSGLALAAAAACSRTDDPVERYASGPATPVAGTGGVGAAPAVGGSSRGGAGNEAGGEIVGGRSGGGNGDAGGSDTPVGGHGPGPDPVVEDCGEAPVSTAAFTQKALRGAAADCAAWQYCRFEGAATVLEARLDDYAATPDDARLLVARRALAKAMDVWSEVELFQFGPLASSSEAAGKDAKQGKGIRELIYAWPQTVRYRVEEQVVSRLYLEGFESETVYTSARGLFALDYLLSYQGTDTACTANSLCGKNWAKQDAEGLASLKREYAAAVGQDVLSRIRELRQLWSPTGGDFRSSFVDLTGYDDEPQAMTTLAWALLYAEREIKDYKLGVPAGYTLTHPVTLPEMPYSGRSTEAIRGNLRGFRALFQGCGPTGTGMGVDDWLSGVQHPELAQDIVTALDGAQAAAESAPPLATATPAELETFYRALKTLTDLLKNDLFGAGSPLGLKLPDGIASDTD
jgi:predicted lipoprotein